MSVERQLDLFSASGSPTERLPLDDVQRPPRLAAETLGDDALIVAIPDAGVADCHILAEEAGRRRLIAAVPALEALCRRFRGFGLRHAVSEQTAALRGLAAIGGREAAAAVTRIIVDGVVQEPGLRAAIGASIRLQCRLPPAMVAALLQSPDPEIRADTARCARSHPKVIALLADLLHDLNCSVANAAACALGRLGRSESRETLVRLLRDDPSSEVIDSVVAIADETCIVLLGRIARSSPALADDAVAALTEIEGPRAAAVLSALKRTRSASAAVSVTAATARPGMPRPPDVNGPCGAAGH